MKEQLTPMMKQFNALKQQYPDAILLFRLGDFYEMFGEDATVASQILNIQLTKRNKQASAPVMCGIPQRSFETYVNKLSLAGLKIAVCEQIGTPETTPSNEIVKREVTQVITPGTVLSRTVLDVDKNNFICILYFSLKYKQLGLSLCDMTTGELETCQFKFQNGLTHLKEIFARYQPCELLFQEEQNENETHFIKELLNLLYPNKDLPFIDKLDPQFFNAKQSAAKIKDQFNLENIDVLSLGDLPLALRTTAAMLHYLEYSQKALLSHLQTPKLCNFQNTLILDVATIKNLELLQDSTGSRSHSLIHLLDKAKTPMGKRLFRRWLLAPLTKLDQIKTRQSFVHAFLEQPIEMQQLRETLQKIGDIERDITRISLPSFQLNDFANLRDTLRALKNVQPSLALFKNKELAKLAESLDTLNDISTILEEALVEELTFKKQDGNFINPSYHTQVKELRFITENASSFLTNLEEEQKKLTGISSLKVRENRVYGLYIEVSKTMSHKIPDTYIRRQTLAHSERFITKELQEQEEKLLSAREELYALELVLLQEIQEEIRKHTLRMQKTAKQLAYIDCLSSLALLAQQENYTCPAFGEQLSIQEGKHPVLAAQNDVDFISNDIYMNKEDLFILLLTGPNMGGKSTYMRQTALLCLMAQIGSFIPAKSATLPLLDRIFTRVGASDNITSGQSTFMVEMSETAVILQNATQQSLVILDEIGRGTATADGISLAWAILEDLQKKKILTLFATHFHELTELPHTLSGMQNIAVQVIEDNKEISFLHKIVQGSASKSYGIHVAKLAGVPKSILTRAQTLLSQIESEQTKVIATQQNVDLQEKQIPLFAEESREDLLAMEQEICQLNLDELTPLQAITFLATLQEKLRSPSK